MAKVRARGLRGCAVASSTWSQVRVGAPGRHGDRAMRWRRLALLVVATVVMLLAVAWLGEDDGGFASQARSALRALARALF